jgi:putative ABC transport system permease protein
MNMMLTTVSERTKEIGLRKAIGAHNRDILAQILLESIMMTFLGGIIGIILTYMAALVANRVIPEDSFIQVILSFKVLLISVVVSIFVGIIFGYYPAKNAARLQPVDALRSE